MEFLNQKPSRQRIVASPPGRGWKRRREVVVTPDYVRTLLEQARLTERDELLLRYLAVLAVLSSTQIWRLLWPDTGLSNATRRLRQLYDYHLIDRVRMLDKADGIIYSLGKAGRLWLYGEARGSVGPRVNTAVLRHDLAVAEVLVLLSEEVRRADPENRLKLILDWQGEAEARIVHGERVLVEPDALLRLNTLNHSWPYYLELDRGTEGLAAFESKAKHYLQASRQVGLRDEKSRQPVAIMIVTTTPERAAKLANLVAAQQQHQKKELEKLPKPPEKSILPFWFITTLDQLTQAGFFGSERWYVVTPDLPAPLHQTLRAPWGI